MVVMMARVLPIRAFIRKEEIIRDSNSWFSLPEPRSPLESMDREGRSRSYRRRAFTKEFNPLPY